MSFVLNNSGVGCYSLLFKGEHIGAVFSSEHDGEEPWIALIYDGWAARSPVLPVPFTSVQHRFHSLQDLRRWLGLAPRAALSKKRSPRRLSGGLNGDRATP